MVIDDNWTHFYCFFLNNLGPSGLIKIVGSNIRQLDFVNNETIKTIKETIFHVTNA